MTRRLLLEPRPWESGRRSTALHRKAHSPRVLGALRSQLSARFPIHPFRFHRVRDGVRDEVANGLAAADAVPDL